MRKLADTIKDIYYPKINTNRNRETSRGVILDENNNILLLHIKCNDIFGNRDHYELPGGGIEDEEDDIQALKREIKEELGYLIDDIKEIGSLSIEYNLLSRIDNGHFYSAKTKEYVGSSLQDYEKKLFKDIVKINVSDIISFYENQNPTLVGKMIHERDLIVIKNYLKGEGHGN